MKWNPNWALALRLRSGAEEMRAWKKSCSMKRIAWRRSFYEVRAAHSEETRLWTSPGSTAWTVVYETDARFQISCLNRFIYIKTAGDLSEALQGADSVRGRVSTVGLAAPEDKAQEL